MTLSLFIANKQVLFRFSDLGLAGIPDGMVIDENDNLWIAIFAGGQILNVDTRKPNTLIKTIDLPTKVVRMFAIIFRRRE